MGKIITDRYMDILRKRYIENMSMRDIVEEYGLTSIHRVRQIEKKAIRKLLKFYDREGYRKVN